MTGDIQLSQTSLRGLLTSFWNESLEIETTARGLVFTMPVSYPDGWQVVDVPRALADELLRQGVIAEGGFHIGHVQITASAYYAGVRLGAALGIGRR